MQVLRSLKELKEFRDSFAQNATLGLVPTMGALHEGHISLLQTASQHTSVTLVSIFVNPLQFNDSGDFEKYPKQIEKDLNLLEHAGCHAVFVPDASELYLRQPVLSFRFGYLEELMEAKHRPGHFNGVGIVVSKLFHLIKPHKAFFGEKDLQQLRVIQCLVQDLSIPIDVVPCPTLREADGLAMSSRNMRLSPAERQRALLLNRSLHKAKSLLGIQGHRAIEQQISKDFEEAGEKLDYFQVVNAETLLSCRDEKQTEGVALCIAAFIGDVRLIDNMIVYS